MRKIFSSQAPGEISTESERAREHIWALWWHAVDRWILVCSLILMLLGTWLIMAGSPAVAEQHQWTPFVLLKKHLIFLCIGNVLMIATSFLRKESVLPLIQKAGAILWILLWVVLGVGASIKGAKRWINIGYFSLQPAEFVKPVLAIWTAYILSHCSEKEIHLRFFKVLGLVVLAIVPLLLQPDLGSVFLICATAVTQCFIAGLDWRWVGATLLAGLSGLLMIILSFPHAMMRFKNFFGNQADPFGEQYQIIQSLKSFASGGLLGKGPGAGVILNHLPDGHADFIFAVAGEELGLIACLGILGLYSFMIIRATQSALREMNLGNSLALVGLTVQFSYQVLLNVACVLKMVPTKGVTLPLLSYGGSSFLSVCWTIGLLLCLSRRYRSLL